MNTKHNKKYKSNSEKIETTFLTLLLNHKYETITVSQICETAVVHRSTFYTHYDDINDLVIKIEAKFSNGIASIFDFGLNPTHEAFIEMFRFIEKNKYFYKAFLDVSYKSSAENGIQKQMLANIQNSEQRINANDVDLFYRANYFGAGIKELCRIWLSRDCQESPEHMASLLYHEYNPRKQI